MRLLLLGLVVFFATHAVSIVAPYWRDRVVFHWGELRWRVCYSLLSLAGLCLIIAGMALARQSPVILYVPSHWMRSLALWLMVPVFPLLLATWLPGRISATLKHPTLVAVKLWALAHLLANGMEADVWLFGGFLLWAALVRVSVRHRPMRTVATFAARPVNDWLVLLLGLGCYALFLSCLHRLLIGVSPLS
jgi:uncharacterized membrane protein